MDASGPCYLRWTCPRCGAILIVEGPLDSSFELFLFRADVHIEDGCDVARRSAFE